MTRDTEQYLIPAARQAIGHFTGWRNGPSIPDDYGDCGFWAFQATDTDGLSGDSDSRSSRDDRSRSPPIRYVVGCKNYEHSDNGLYRGRYASFTPPLLARALSTRHRTAPYREDAPPRAGARHPRRSWLVLFAGPGHDPDAREWAYTIDDAWVFDPERVYSHGQGEHVPYTKRVGRETELFDLDAKANGVPLGAHLEGRKRPEPAHQPVDAGRQVGLNDYGVEFGGASG